MQESKMRTKHYKVYLKTNKNFKLVDISEDISDIKRYISLYWKIGSCQRKGQVTCGASEIVHFTVMSGSCSLDM